jgi:predicted porin
MTLRRALLTTGRRRALLAAAAALSGAFGEVANAATDPAVEAQLKALAQQLQAVQQQSNQQLQIVQQQSNQQIRALTQQVQALQAQLQAAKISENVLLPPAKGTVLTKNPGNMDAVSTIAPYTAAGPGAPDNVPKLPAAVVSSGADRVKVSISGQVDRAEIYGNDGRSATTRNVDNNNSSSRLRFVGEGRINADTSGGFNIETQITPNSSANTSLTQDSPSSINNFTPTGGSSANNVGGTFTARQVEAFVQNKNWGAVRLGFGSTASYLTTEVDQSGTAVASYVNIADLDGGFSFRQRGAARIPGTAKGSFVTSPANAFGPSVGSVFNYMDGLVRDDRVRYDSPMFGPVQFSGSLVDGGAFDLAVRYGAIWDGIKISAAFSFADADGRNHSAPSNAYGYASAPIGSGPLATASIADTSANAAKQYAGSLSVLLPDGLNATVAGGTRDVKYTDPLGRALSPVMYYGKLGYLTHFWDFGQTAFAVDYNENDELNFAGDAARGYGVALVQNVDDAGLELFLSGHRQTLTRDFASYYAITTVEAGARVRF